jgi:hypothetical protein
MITTLNLQKDLIGNQRMSWKIRNDLTQKEGKKT